MIEQVECLEADLGLESANRGQLRERGVDRELPGAAQDVAPGVPKLGGRLAGGDERGRVEPSIDRRIVHLSRSNPIWTISRPGMAAVSVDCGFWL